MSESGWPTLRGWELAAALAVMSGGVVAGLLLSAGVVRRLTSLFCTASGCNDVILSVIGWSVFGLPLIALFLLYLKLRPSRPAMWALIITVTTMGLTAATIPPLTRKTRDAYAEMPELNGPGWGSTVAFAGLVVGALLARAYSGPSDDDTTAKMRLGIIAAGQLAALLVAVATS